MVKLDRASPDYSRIPDQLQEINVRNAHKYASKHTKMYLCMLLDNHWCVCPGSLPRRRVSTGGGVLSPRSTGEK